MSASDAWREWLARPNCLKVLENAARAVYRQALRLSLPANLLPCTNPWTLSEEDRRDCFQTLAHDLWLFLRDRPELWKERNDLQELLSEQGQRFMEMKISQGYLQHLKDQARTFEQGPWRALYRRLRQLLGSEKSICYRATREAAFYSLDSKAPELPVGTDLQGVPYTLWESPLAKVDAANLLRKDQLLWVARFFWEQTRARLGKGYFLPVRELTHYLGAHYPSVANAPIHVPIRHGGGGDESGHVELASQTAENDIVVSAMRSDLPGLARSLTAQWKEKQQKVFYLIQGEELTLEQAAARLGYASAASVSYVRDAVFDNLRDFCQLWPGLSPPDLDKAFFCDFVTEVLEICKKQF